MSRPIQPLPNVQQPRARGKIRVAGVMAAALVISWGAPAANAYWQTLNSGALGATADSILAMAVPTASASAGAATVGWAEGSTAAGRPVSGYTVARYSSESGGIKVDAGGACAGTITTLTCSEAALPAGTWYYTVTPVLSLWAGVESARSGGVTAADTTAPDAPTITAPAIVNSDNVDDVQVRGTAEAGSSVTVIASDAGAVHTESQTVSADPEGLWALSSFNLTGLSDPTISYSAVATDAAGNASAPATATSTKDAAAPRVTTVVLSNGRVQFKPDAGDKVALTFSEPLLSSTICGTWTNPSSSQTVNGTVTITDGNLLTFGTTDAACPSVKFGSVAFNGSYGDNLTFNSSLTWNPGTLQLTVTLGSLISGTPASKSGNVMPTYTPAAGLTDIVGNSLATTPFAGTNSRF